MKDGFEAGRQWLVSTPTDRTPCGRHQHNESDYFDTCLSVSLFTLQHTTPRTTACRPPPSNPRSSACEPTAPAANPAPPPTVPANRREEAI